MMKNIHSSLDFRSTAIFIQAARDGSFTRAAEHLFMTPSAVSKAINRLEEDLGVKLLSRTPRAVTLTPAGSRFFEEAERLALAVERARSAVRDHSILARRRLRSVLPIHFGRTEIAPHLPLFAERHPEVDLEYLIVNNGQMDLVAQDVDVALIVGGRFDLDPAYLCKNMATHDMVMCASPLYLQRFGTPDTIADLDAHRTLGAIDEGIGDVMPWALNYNGRPIEHLPRFNMLSNSIDVLLRMAVAGSGIVLLPDYIARDGLQSGNLCVVLPDHRPEPQRIQILQRRSRAGDPDVMAFVELLETAIAQRKPAPPAQRRRSGRQ
ncbi:MAG: LysR family transcriptional regulator [Porticoccaceae bacterium]